MDAIIWIWGRGIWEFNIGKSELIPPFNNDS